MGSPFREPVLAPPRGFRDILPTEARELRAIEHALSETFASHGYVPIEPPMVEHVTPDSGAGRHGLMLFLDRDGSLVALRPDITTAVARLVARPRMLAIAVLDGGSGATPAVSSFCSSAGGKRPVAVSTANTS